MLKLEITATKFCKLVSKQKTYFGVDKRINRRLEFEGRTQIYRVSHILMNMFVVLYLFNMTGYLRMFT